ncbi:unnamed protein product [Oreochromis niloticus]|nr:unnamed protein product [Mustela putorius furo]
MANINKDHGYHLAALRQACDEEGIEWMEQQHDLSQDKPQADRHHTPVKSPNPKKMKANESQTQNEVSNTILLNAIQKLVCKFDTQSEHLKSYEFQLQENTDAVRKVKESVDANTQAVKSVVEDVKCIKTQMATLKKENEALREMCLEHARYKRRWSLLLTGVPEREGENTREEIIRILTKIIPANAEQLYNTVDTVHRLGQKGRVGDKPRLIVIQFAMRTVRDLVWKMSKEAKFCKEMKIRFREDFCKEDREARKRLWPRVEEARSRGLKAFLKEGYAVIDGRQIKE